MSVSGFLSFLRRRTEESPTSQGRKSGYYSGPRFINPPPSQAILDFLAEGWWGEESGGWSFCTVGRIIIYSFQGIITVLHGLQGFITLLYLLFQKKLYKPYSDFISEAISKKLKSSIN